MIVAIRAIDVIQSSSSISVVENLVENGHRVVLFGTMDHWNSGVVKSALSMTHVTDYVVFEKGDFAKRCDMIGEISNRDENKNPILIVSENPGDAHVADLYGHSFWWAHEFLEGDWQQWLNNL